MPRYYNSMESNQFIFVRYLHRKIVYLRSYQWVKVSLSFTSLSPIVFRSLSSTHSFSFSQDVDIFNKNLIEDPTKQLPGFDLPRKIWCKLNRFRTGHGKCNNMLFHWNIRENPSCECGAEKETIQHILEECPLTKFQQGFSKLHLLTEDALNWLQQIKNI
jgi:hypothetical protein